MKKFLLLIIFIWGTAYTAPELFPRYCQQLEARIYDVSIGHIGFLYLRIQRETPLNEYEEALEKKDYDELASLSTIYKNLCSN